jgi:hypothetical protein
VKTLKDLAIRLFKQEPPPSARLSYVLGVRQRQVQYWLAGRDLTPDDVLQIVEGQIAAVEKFDLKGRIDQLVTEATAAGIDPSVTGHYLATAVDSSKD